MTLKTKIDPTQTELTDEQQEAIFNEAMAEYEGVEVEEVKEEVADLEGEKTEVIEEEVKEEDAKEEEAKEETEEKPKEEQQEEVKEEKKEDVKQEITDEEVKKYAYRHNLTEQDAREELEKDYNTVRFYETPQNLARTVRKLQAEVNQFKNSKPETEKTGERQTVYSLGQDQAVRVIETEIRQNSEAIVDKYRQDYPHQSEMMTDEAILERVRHDALSVYSAKVQQRQAEVKSLAEEKRAELMESLDEFDKQFAVDIKVLLKNTDDNHLVSEDFDMKDILRWARGANVQQLIKEAEERGYKRGSEEAKVMGEKAPVKQSSQQGVKKSPNSALNEDQKSRALNMFASVEGDDEFKFKLYRETFEEELKSNPNFLG